MTWRRKGFTFLVLLCVLFFLLFVLGFCFWFCFVGLIPELTLTLLLYLWPTHYSGRERPSVMEAAFCVPSSKTAVTAFECQPVVLLHLSTHWAAPKLQSKLGSWGYLGSCLYKLIKWRYPALKIGSEKHAWLLESLILGSLLHAMHIYIYTLIHF